MEAPDPISEAARQMAAEAGLPWYAQLAIAVAAPALAALVREILLRRRDSKVVQAVIEGVEQGANSLPKSQREALKKAIRGQATKDHVQPYLEKQVERHTAKYKRLKSPEPEGDPEQLEQGEGGEGATAGKANR